MEERNKWWRDPDALQRYVIDLVQEELARLRPGAALPPRPWKAELDLVGADLGCDSLELLTLSAAVAEAVQMHRTGVEDYLLARRTIGDWTSIVAAALERFGAELTFRTSGTTGAPKPKHHALSKLWQEIDEWAPRFSDRRRILCAVPAHHIYGFLFSVLLPQRLGAAVVDVRAQSPGGVGAMLGDGDLVIGHPAFWSAFVRTGVVTAADVSAVTSTAPCPAAVARAVVESGISRLVEVYGSSETGGIAMREDPDAPFRLFTYWGRGPDEATLNRTLPDGGVETIALPDRLEWVDGSGFRVGGRRDHAVQVGGVNVHMDVVRRALCEHPMVRDAAVRLMNPSEGVRLKAFIVPAAPPSDLHVFRRELTAWCDARLSVPERPKAFNFGPALPRGAMGKAADWSVVEDEELGSTASC